MPYNNAKLLEIKSILTSTPYDALNPVEKTTLFITPVEQDPPVTTQVPLAKSKLITYLIEQSKLEGIMLAAEDDQATGHLPAYAFKKYLDYGDETIDFSLTITQTILTAAVATNLITSTNKDEILALTEVPVLKSPAELNGVHPWTLQDTEASLAAS